MLEFIRIISFFIAVTFTLSCGVHHDIHENVDDISSNFSIIVGEDSSYMISTAWQQDTLCFHGSLHKIVCMSSTYIASLSAIGCVSSICGVSGIQYVSDTEVRNRYDAGLIIDVGQDINVDFEKIMSMSPDLVVTYSYAGSEDTVIAKLKSLGLPVLVLNDYLEDNPLARASYMKVFGTLTGHESKADSVFNVVCERYHVLADKIVTSGYVGDKRCNVLMNIPYADAWYIPGGNSYMARLVNDAGGNVLGAVYGKTESSVISVEQAIMFSASADFWLNTGWCDTREELYDQNPLFRSMSIPYIYNNTLRSTNGGGNDFWEGGAVRPDMILHDLITIFHPEILEYDNTGLYYYKEVK